MDRRVYARMNGGMGSLMRVVGMLKKRRFNVKSFNMEQIHNSGHAYLLITLEVSNNSGVMQAVNLMEKLNDVYEVKELKEGL